MEPTPQSPDVDPLVVVGRFSEPFDAHIVVGALQAAGLVATIQQEHLAGLHAPFSFAAGGALVLVPSLQAAEALQVLRNLAVSR